MTVDSPTKPPARKGVLVGGECDGMVVRIDFDPPHQLVVLVTDAPAGYQPTTAYVVTGHAFPPAVAGRPVRYLNGGFAAVLPDATRVTIYVPEADL